MIEGVDRPAPPDGTTGPAPSPSVAAWAADPWPNPAPGRTIGIVDWVGTLLFAVVAVLAAVFLGGIRSVAVGVSLALFAVGTVAFLWGYAIAVQRSRDHEIGIGGLYFLAGHTAPKEVRRSLNVALAVQVVVGVATASVRPFTTLAFGVLVPMLGLGLNGLWAARYGRFGPRALRSAATPSGAADDDDSTEGGPIGQNAPHG